MLHRRLRMPFTLPPLIAHSNCKHTTKIENGSGFFFQIELSSKIHETGQITE